MRRYLNAALLVVLLIVLLLSAASKNIPSDRSAPVTPVSGSSWIHHLQMTIDQTRLAQMGGSSAPAATTRQEPDLVGADLNTGIHESFRLSGADLYRLNCQSCHGPAGTGAPPEINSLIEPVQATSAQVLEQRMAQRGMPMDPAMAHSLARDAERSIRDRLQHGGKHMPSFAQLRPEEVAALLAYLRQLAGVPGTRTEVLVNEPAAHVGEEIVKGTCHTCHDATGPAMRCMRGMGQRIPSLAGLPDTYGLDGMIRQVHDGSQMMMMCRQQMPALPFFTSNEIAAAYFYLQAYPPQAESSRR